MRMICPNCGAQYEVDDSVIPEQGRDVQCSNCGHTWFQQPAHLDTGLAEELGQEPDEAAPASEAEPDDPPDPAPAPERRGLDPQIAEVLRQEAEHEAEARRAETDGLEVQPGLGIDDADRAAADRSAAARARTARMRGQDENAEDAEAAAALSSRRDLLPDVEEINSSLTAASDREAEDMTAADTATTARRGGRKLSRLIIIAAILAVLVYALAPRIIEFVPAAEPYLIAYVDWANTVRAQINGLVSMAMEKIGGLTG